MKLYTLFCLSLLFVTACVTPKKEQPISKAEATAFAEKLETSVKRGEQEQLDNVLNEDLFAEEVVKASGSENDRSVRAGLKAGKLSKTITREIYTSMGKDGLYEFLKEYEKNGHQHVIFRLLGQNGFNYHDYELVKYDDKISAKDIYLYLTGENMSQTIAELMNASLKTGNDKGDTYSKTLTGLKSLIKQKDYATAKKLIDKLPLSLKNNKAVQLMNLQITSKMEDDVYMQAIKEYENLFKQDASAQLVLFDSYFLQGDFDKSLHLLDQIDTAVHDPLLNYYRALVYTQKKEPKTAVRYLEKLYQEMPYYGTGVLELMANYIEANQYKEANGLIAAYKKNTSFDQQKLQQVKDLYPDANGLNW